jgi:hypothetical protein
VFNEKEFPEMQTVTAETITPPTTVTAHWLQCPFEPLDQVDRPTVSTEQAAYYLNRKPQTLRAWACLEVGPLRPIRINCRLAWSVDKIKLLLNGGAV